MFSDALRVYIDTETKTVRLSIRVSDNSVQTFVFPLSLFKHLMDEFHSQLRDSDD